MRDQDKAVGNVIMYPMISMVNMLHGRLMFRVFSGLDGRFVVHKKR